MRTSYGDRTSPVLRGAWVLDKIIGTPPTPPPPNVDTNLAPSHCARLRRPFAPGWKRTATRQPASSAMA